MSKPRPAPAFSFTPASRFFLGVNYWASHAGTRMWADWRPEIVEADLSQMARAGLRVLRVFPLWPDFQPIRSLAGYAGQAGEIRLGEEPLPGDPAGQAGVSADMLDRFQFLADRAAAHGLELVVGLVTGWMSGRLYVPPALEGRNVLTDPLALRWQIRFVRVFVGRFKDHPAVTAWDLGNECNCMGAVASADEAWAWTSHLASAIRAADPSRPVVSGMHGLLPAPPAHWRIRDQAELTDVLTTHPYPVFTPHCDRDPVNTIRPILHAAAESRFYADIGGKPCFAEELGTLGPMIGSEGAAAGHLRAALFSLWAHGCHGLLWWCAYDQDRLAHAPYDWTAAERELGLFRADRSAKPAAAELTRFDRFLETLPLPALPPRLVDGVCLVPGKPDPWGAAFSSFLLASQAGLCLEFQSAELPFREAPLYVLPSVGGLSPFSRRFWLELLDRVRRGAVLYVSLDDGFLSPFKEHFGVEVETRERRESAARLRMDGLPGAPRFTVAAKTRLNLKAAGAEVLGREEDGNPAFVRRALGKGQVFFLAVPLERALAEAAGAFHRPDAPPYADLYRRVAAEIPSRRIAACSHPAVGVTEHPHGVKKRILVLVNYGPAAAEVPLTLAKGWRVADAWRGPKPAGGAVAIGPNDAAVLVAVRAGR